jgi:uncharacterized membrane protein
MFKYTIVLKLNDAFEKKYKPKKKKLEQKMAKLSVILSIMNIKAVPPLHKIDQYYHLHYHHHHHHPLKRGNFSASSALGYMIFKANML